jgi:hypothetical protein
MAISPALRGISRILALLDEQIDFRKKSVKTSAFKWLQDQSGFYLTGQVVAAYNQVRLTPQNFGGPRKAGFRKAQLASACLPKPRRRQGPF